MAGGKNVAGFLGNSVNQERRDRQDELLGIEEVDLFDFSRSTPFVDQDDKR